MADNEQIDQNFSPNDLTDGRPKGDWDTRYNEEAQKAIGFEKRYLIIVLAISVLAPVLFGIIQYYTSLFDCFAETNFQFYFYGWFGGLLGGTAFAIKWLIHTVAKNTWNLDRRLWRIFTPHISSALALVFSLLIINKYAFTIDNVNIEKIYFISFIVGYFSDNAFAKLAEVAQVFFGTLPKKSN